MSKKVKNQSGHILLFDEEESQVCCDKHKLVEEDAEELNERELNLKLDLFDENMEDDEQEEQLQGENDEEQEPNLDALIMEIKTEDYEVTEKENAFATSIYSQEHLQIKDEDEILLSQGQQEIKEIRIICKKMPTNSKFIKKAAESLGESTAQQEYNQEQKNNVEKESNLGVAQMSSKIITNIGDDRKQAMEIILPPKRKRVRPARSSDDYEKNKKLKVKTKPTDGYLSEEPTNEEFKFECGLCPKKYKSCVIYKRHMNDVHNIIDDTIVEYTCEECSKTFSSKRNLKMHKRSHLPIELKREYPCPHCDKRYTNEAIMVQHIRGVHLNEKPFICGECGRGLKTNAALKDHKLTHTDDCPFECEVCHKRFKNKARLKIHSDIHAETIYKCAVCGIILNTRRSLNMHMLVHSNVKAFKCDYCGNAFKRTTALKNHLLIHTGLKPYICNFCFKSFSNGSNCRSHKKRVHPEELAALEASGEKVHQDNVPKLDNLRAVSSSYSVKFL